MIRSGEPRGTTDDSLSEYGLGARVIIRVAPPAFWLLAQAWFRTFRVTYIGREQEDQFLRRGEPVALVSWHQGLLYFPYHFRNRNGVAMVSHSKDGEVIAQILKRFGLQSARGSSSRGGRRALDTMVAMVKASRCCAGLVADGPKGPFGVAKMGIIVLGKETGLPLIPVMWWAERKIMLRNWDRTIVPMPFTRLVFLYDAPVWVPSEATAGEEFTNAPSLKFHFWEPSGLRA